MTNSSWIRWVAAPAALVTTAGSLFATTYFTVEQAQRAIFPGATFSPVEFSLDAAQRSAIEKACGVRVRDVKPKVWKAAGGGWFIVDEVLGKHEYITYAIGLNADGAVRQIEVMEYRESYGFEVRNETWRRQFSGKTQAAPLKLDADIQNISGATLSARHVTDGVKRILAFHALVLRRG